MVIFQGSHLREFVWAVAGACAGSVVRLEVDQMWPVRPFESMLFVTTAAAWVVGFALVAPIWGPLRTALIAAGGAAASISAVANQAALAIGVQSLVDLAGFFGCVVAGIPLGMLLALAVMPNARRAERR